MGYAGPTPNFQPSGSRMSCRFTNCARQSSPRCTGVLRDQTRRTAATDVSWVTPDFNTELNEQPCP